MNFRDLDLNLNSTTYQTIQLIGMNVQERNRFDRSDSLKPMPTFSISSAFGQAVTTVNRITVLKEWVLKHKTQLILAEQLNYDIKY